MTSKSHRADSESITWKQEATHLGSSMVGLIEEGVVDRRAVSSDARDGGLRRDVAAGESLGYWQTVSYLTQLLHRGRVSSHYSSGQGDPRLGGRRPP